MLEELKYSGINKGITYTAGALFLDVIVGQVVTGRPLHESLGIEFPEYVQKAEEIVLAAGWVYLIFKSTYNPEKKTT